MEEEIRDCLLSEVTGGETTGALRCSDLHRKLESTIFNSVSLGQWESARACLRSIAQSGDSKVCESTRELLKVLILDASNYWSESTGIPSPHHLSWLALDAYKSFFEGEDSSKLPGYIGAMIEFRLLLYQVKGMLSFSSRVANFLCQYHSTHVLQVPGTTYDAVPSFPSASLTFLHDVITMQDPSLGHSLIQSLTVCPPSYDSSSTTLASQYASNNESLQGVYLDCINECLEALDTLKASAAAREGEDSDSQYESDHASSSTIAKGSSKGRFEKAVSMVYTLLSMIEAQPGMMHLTKKVDSLFAVLLQASYPLVTRRSKGQDKPRPVVVTFEPGKLYACLLGRSNGYLICRLSEVEYYLRRKRVAEESSLVVSHARCGSLPRSGAANREENDSIDARDDSEAAESQRAVFTSKDEWKDRFYDGVFENKHLLESVLERGLQLVCTGHLEAVSRLLDRTEFIPLRPVLLLLGWDRYNATGSGKELLDALWPMEVSMKQSLLYSGCCKMAFLVELVQWCLDKARPQVQRCAGDMFKGLKSHSTLYVLHHSTPLASLDPLEVVDILKMRPRVPSRSSLLSPPPQFSRGVTPIKGMAGSEFDSARVSSPLLGMNSSMGGIGGGEGGGVPRMLSPTLKPEQERDISVFRSFCALKLVLDALWNSVLLRDGIVPRHSETGTRQTEKTDSAVSGELSQNAAGSNEASSSKQGSKKVARKLDLGSEELKSALASENVLAGFDIDEETASPADKKQVSLAQHYKTFVTDLLMESKLYLAHVYPLTYRLEILENIFSILFITSKSVRSVKYAEGANLEGNFDEINGSYASTISSFVALVRGRNEFLVNEKLAEELLEVLQDCIRELRAAKYALQQMDSTSFVDGSSLSYDGVQSSVSEGTLNARIMRLEQYVNEARWRLQMVLSEQAMASPLLSSGSSKSGSLFDVDLSEDSASGWGTNSEDEEEGGGEKVEKGSGGGGVEISGKEKLSRKKKRGVSLVSLMGPKDDGSESVSSRTTDSAHVQRPLSRGSSVGSHPVSSLGRKSPSPRPSSAISTPAPRPPGFSTPNSAYQKRGSPTIAVTSHRQYQKQKSSGSLTSRSETFESKSSSKKTSSSHIEEDSGECADVEERSPLMAVHRKRKRKRTKSQSSHFASSHRKRRLQLNEQLSEPKPSRSSIVSRMLSSAGSLLRVCLRHSNYMKAGEVVQTLHMEGKLGEAIIQFSEQFEAVGRELSQQSRMGTPTQTKKSSVSSGSSVSSASHHHSTNLSHSATPPLRSSASPKPSFSYSAGSQSSSATAAHSLTQGSSLTSMNLQVAIMNARSSYDPLQGLHQLLAPPTIHQMLFSGDAELEWTAGEHEGLYHLSKHVPSLIMLDMVIGQKMGGAMALKIIEMAQDRLGNSAAGIQEFAGPLALLKLVSGASSHFPPSAGFNLSSVSLVPAPHTSPHALLTVTTHKLTLGAISLARTFTDTYREAREKMEAEIDHSMTEISAGKDGSDMDVFSQLVQLVSGEEGNGSGSSGGKGSPSTPLRQQTSPLGSIFDELIRALHSMPPTQSLYPDSVLSGGEKGSSSLQHLPKATEGSSSCCYLWQFNHYIRKFIELLVKCLGMKPGNLNKGSLVLSVMEETPYQMLGRLIFEKGIPPVKLESMMGDFPHLPVVAVLVKCCCQEIASRGVVLGADSIHPSAPVLALNQGSAAHVEGDLCDFSYELLSQLLGILRDHCVTSHSQGSLLLPGDLASLYKNAEVQALLKRTSSLASVDLKELTSMNHQMVFYTNILNFLYLHSLLFCCHSFNAGNRDTGNFGGSEDLPTLPPCLRGITLPMLESSRVVQMGLFGKVGYRLGQLGVVSCLDLHHSILCRTLTPPTICKEIGLKLRLTSTSLDPWMSHTPATPNPCLFYVIHDGQLSCSYPSALTIENFSSALSSAEGRYLTANVTIDHGKRTVAVARPLLERRQDFVKATVSHVGEAPPTFPTHVNFSDMLFLRYLKANLDTTKADALSTMMELWETSKSKRIQLVSKEVDSKIGYNLTSSEWVPKGMASPSGKGSPKLPRRQFSRELSRKESQPGNSMSLAVIKEYSLSPGMMDFVKNQKPLLAGFVALVCPVKGLSGSKSRLGGGGGDEEPSRNSGSKDGSSGKDQEKEENSKFFIKNLRSKMTSPIPVQSPVPASTSATAMAPSSLPVSPTRSLTFPKIPGISDDRDLHSTTPWRRHYQDIISHFPQDSPMIRYLEVRVLPFEDNIPWLAGEKKDASALNVSSLALVPPGSQELEEACMITMKALVESGNLSEAIKFLATEPAIKSSQVHALSHLALSSYFVSNYLELIPQKTETTVALRTSDRKSRSSRNASKRSSKGDQLLFPVNPIPILSQLSDPECTARLTLASLEVWPVDMCVGLLEFCLHHLPSSSSLVSPLSEKLEKMHVYSRIMVACEAVPHTQGGHRQGRNCPWKSWIELAEDSVSKTEFVLGRLLDVKEFSLAREWCSVHTLSGSITQQIEVEYLFNLLEGEEPNPIVAHQKLDSLADERTSLEVCESLMQEKENQQKSNRCTSKKDLNTIVFILQYMLTRLSVSLANRPEYTVKLLGAKALLCLPPEVYSDYSIFMSSPLLMVEQLIMDLKIEWAAAVVRELRSTSLLKALVTDDTPSPSSSILEDEDEGGRSSDDPFTQALVFYCSKALDFHETILTNSTPAPSVVPSVASTEPSTPVMYPNNHRYPQAGRGGGAMNFVGHARKLSQDQFPSATPRVPPVTVNRRRASGGVLPVDAPSGTFHPPPEPPTKDKWERDEDAKDCRVCSGQFGMFMRRHHCRRCGRVVCATCSSHNLEVKGYNRGPVRVCTGCYHLFSPLSSSETSGHHHHGNTSDRGDGRNSIVPIGGSEGEHMSSESFPPLQSRLVPGDKMANENLRTEFYYERTPNTALCLSLADMLASKELGAQLVLDCCHTVSAKLVPDSQGCVNAELDHHFVINLIQNLLHNAKLRYVDTNLSSGVEVCDTYLSRVDLLRLMVTSRYSKIPSLLELTKPDLARRVRDRLIQDDRFSLAMEVSTKCQLDSGAVWSAWGLALLKCGEFSDARTKLQKCFKVSSQSGSRGQNAHLIQRILEQIEQKPLSVASRHTRFCDDWTGVMEGSLAITQRVSNECGMDPVRFVECMFYLNTYAPHSSTVSFLVRHTSWKRACRYIIDKGCSSDVFVENLWIPVLKSGYVEEVMACMRELDPSLGAWEPHLTAACLFFSKKSLFSVLLTTQLCMNDHVRAGLTCVKFFVGFAGRYTTIEDLFDRVRHLDQAIIFLHKAKEKAVSADKGRNSMRARVQRVFEDATPGGGPKGGSSPGVRSMSTSELNSHLETMQLQKEVVKHLHMSAREMGTLRVPLSGGNIPDLKSPSGSGRSPLSPPPTASTSSHGHPPTLFGNSKTRGEVATLVITGSRDLEAGFSLTLRIIAHYKMNMRQVFCETARGLAIKHRHGEVRRLLQCIQQQCQSKSVNMDAMNDDIVMAAVEELAKQTRDIRDHGKLVDKLVGLLMHERNRIKAFIQCGKFKSAYLTAVRAKMADEVQKISEIANRAGQLSVRDICDKWLQANAPYLLQRQ